MENPVKSIVLTLKDGRVLNVELSSVKGIRITTLGDKTSISIEFDVSSCELHKNLPQERRELGE